MVKHGIFARHAIALALIGTALVACGNSSGNKSSGTAAAASTAAASMVPYSGTDKILAIDAAAKKVTVNLIAGEGTAANGFNFNGYANGDMQVQVPTGWTIKVSMVDDASTPHSAVVAPWDERTSNKLQAAFKGSAPADYKSGIEKGDDPQTFSFAADKAGQYAVVCGVPSHAEVGMWDELDVVDNLAAPQVLVKK